MNIIHLGIDDISRVISLGLEFYDEGFLPGRFSPKHFTQTWEKLLKMQIGILIGAEQGGEIIGTIGGVMTPDPNDGALVAQEMFWFVAKEYRKGSTGKRLIEAFEQTAKDKGARQVMMVRLANDLGEKIDTFYRMSGYEPKEVHYMKTLEN